MIRPVRADGRIETGGTFVPIVRRRVVERIASAALQRIVLIVAPAGYGKSVALRQFLATAGDPQVRFDVLSEHAQLLGFLRGFADALGEIAPDARTTLAGAYERNAESLTAGTDLAMWMHSHIKSFRGIIAIDDLHLAQEDRSVTQFLSSLIERTKGRVQWVIASRSTQGLPIGTWLAYGESDLAVDEQDLRFSVEEAREAARAFRLGVRDEELYDLLQLTGGWATAMSFALRSSTRSVDLRNISSMTREMIYRYLAEQVYHTLNADERAFVEAAALLPEIDIPVMIAAGYDRAAAVLDDLRQRVAFIQEEGDGVYRLHDLFRDFVIHQLRLKGEEVARNACLEMGAVLDSMNRIPPALRLYSEAGASNRVLDLMTRQGFDLIAKGHADIVTFALERLGNGSSDAIVTGLRGVIEAGRGQYEDGERLLLRALNTTDDPALWAELTLRAATLQLNRNVDATKLLLGLERNAKANEGARLEARVLLSAHYARLGDEALAREHFETVCDALVHVEDEALLARLLHRTGFVVSHLESGEAAKPYLTRAASLAMNHGLWSVCARAYASLALICLMWDGDSTLSLWYAQQAASAATKAGDYFDLQVSLLQILSIETRRGSAERLVQIERQLGDLRGGDSSRAVFLASSQAHRQAWSGRFSDAHRLFAGVVRRQLHPSDRAVTQAAYALCLALDQKRKESAAAVEDSIRVIADEKPEADGFGALFFEVAVQFCALAEALNGRHTAAQRLLKRPPLSSHDAIACLRETVETLTHAARNPSYVIDDLDARVEALHSFGFGGYARYLALAAAAIETSYEAEAVVRLTPAELKIVRSLAAGLTPKEIAAEIGRSVYTVQTHIQNLIDKLGCHGRAEAIAAVRRMGLLEVQ